MAELVMTVGIIGFIAYIILPQLLDVRLNNELSMFKKAYYNAERIVLEMINDDSLYPLPDEGNNFYFANTEEVTYMGQKYQGDEKFARLFAARLDAKNTISCSGATCVFTSPDGIVWTLPKTDFQANQSQTISIDVNGSKSPDCSYGGGDTCIEPDRFNIKVYPIGVIAPGGCMEKEYLERKILSKHAKIETFDKKSAKIKFEDDSSFLVKKDLYNQPVKATKNPKTNILINKK